MSPEKCLLLLRALSCLHYSRHQYFSKTYETTKCPQMLQRVSVGAKYVPCWFKHPRSSKILLF